MVTGKEKIKLATETNIFLKILHNVDVKLSTEGDFMGT